MNCTLMPSTSEAQDPGAAVSQPPERSATSSAISGSDDSKQLARAVEKISRKWLSVLRDSEVSNRFRDSFKAKCLRYLNNLLVPLEPRGASAGSPQEFFKNALAFYGRDLVEDSDKIRVFMTIFQTASFSERHIDHKQLIGLYFALADLLGIVSNTQNRRAWESVAFKMTKVCFSSTHRQDRRFIQWIHMLNALFLFSYHTPLGSSQKNIDIGIVSESFYDRLMLAENHLFQGIPENCSPIERNSLFFENLFRMMRGFEEWGGEDVMRQKLLQHVANFFSVDDKWVDAAIAFAVKLLEKEAGIRLMHARIDLIRERDQLSRYLFADSFDSEESQFINALELFADLMVAKMEDGEAKDTCSGRLIDKMILRACCSTVNPYFGEHSFYPELLDRFLDFLSYTPGFSLEDERCLLRILRVDSIPMEDKFNAVVDLVESGRLRPVFIPELLVGVLSLLTRTTPIQHGLLIRVLEWFGRADLHIDRGVFYRDHEVALLDLLIAPFEFEVMNAPVAIIHRGDKYYKRLAVEQITIQESLMNKILECFNIPGNAKKFSIILHYNWLRACAVESVRYRDFWGRAMEKEIIKKQIAAATKKPPKEGEEKALLRGKCIVGCAYGYDLDWTMRYCYRKVSPDPVFRSLADEILQPRCNKI